MLSLITGIKENCSQLKENDTKLTEIIGQLKVSISNQNTLITKLDERVTRNEQLIQNLEDNNKILGDNQDTLYERQTTLHRENACIKGDISDFSEKLDELEQRSLADRCVLSGPKIKALFELTPDISNVQKSELYQYPWQNTCWIVP